MSAIVHRIDKVEDHPEASGLSLVHVAGEIVVSAKITDPITQHRYKSGDGVVYVSEGSIVPEYILRDGFWDDKHDKGGLAGNKGNRVKMRRFAGVESRGILLALKDDGNGIGSIAAEDGVEHPVSVGDDVSTILGITEHQG